MQNLGVGQSDVGRHGDALPHQEEAVGLFRDLAEDNPERYIDDLAAAVQNLRSALSMLGRDDDLRRVDFGTYPSPSEG